LRAIRHDGTRAYLDPKAEPPAAPPGEAVVRPLRVAIGPDEALSAAGLEAGTPITPGRAFVGVVEQLDPAADKDLRQRWEGRRVVGSPLVACGRCDLCRAGLSAHCRGRRELGRGRDGCLADRFSLPLRNLFEVPREIDDDRAAFALAVAAAAHLPHLLRVEGKPYVTILGDSAAALLAAQVMVRVNASVRVLGSDPAKFTRCEKWGVKHRHMAEVGRRADQDIVVDCTGSPDGLDLALHLVRPRGKVVLTAPTPASSLASLVEHEIDLIGARGHNFPDALTLLARAEIDVLPLITRRMRLADGAAILQTAGAPDQLTVLVDVA
jgi:threonine dehydrogenase-like Zn-dependent dehydrogenase